MSQDNHDNPNALGLQDTKALLLLGEIKGIVQGLKDGQDVMHRRMDGFHVSLTNMDTRLRTVEQKAAVMGAGAGAAMSLGVALIVEGVKIWLSGPGPGK